MISSACLCQSIKKSRFKEYIKYKNEGVFRLFEGVVIGKCVNCGLLKTFPPKTNNLFNPKQSRGDFYESSEDKFSQLFKPIVNLIKKYKNNGSVLDVGCSSGILLTLLKKESFNIAGIEPNEDAYKKARDKLGGDVFQGTLQDFIKLSTPNFSISALFFNPKSFSSSLSTHNP